MKVKEVERTANVAWSPKNSWPIHLAAGTAAQQLDASFSTSAALELYCLNLNDPGNDLTLVSSFPSDDRFHKLTWGDQGHLVGGCDGGVIKIFDTAKLLNKEEGLIAKQQKHTGAVRALDFNAYQTNLLASGAAESDIFIWDLNNLNAPMTPGTKVQPPEDLTCIAWNKQVQHILATAFASRCVVWDLRKNDPIIKLTDTACRLRWSAVAWNPDVATQLCLASEEDQSPFIQLWDLRFATSPVKVLEGHQKGVLSISWCPQDTEMLLSCGKDNKILCWNPNTTYQGGELICDMTSPSQWNFDVSWCPRNPALFSTCSFDGHVSVCSMVGAPQQPQTSTKIADSFPGMELFAQAPPAASHPTPVDLRKPPKWLKRPGAARFGFGGKLVIADSRVITVCQVTSEPGLIARANLLDAALRIDNCSEYCQGKVAASTDEQERTLWQFLLASFAPTPREEYLNLLGFHREDIADKLAKLRLRRGSLDRAANLERSTDTESDLDELADSSKAPTSDGDTYTHRSTVSNGLPPSGPRVPRCYKISTTDDVDGLICEALLLGDTETAVELCVEDARWADAIILAMTGGSDLLARTQHRYLQENSGCLSKLVSAVVTEDWAPVIQNCDVSSWKEALVAALTHSSEEFPVLCEALGERLEPRLAQVCFLCAGNLSKLVSAWMSVNNPSSPDNLQDLVEVVMLLKRAVELRGRSVDLSGGIGDLLSRYAIILASEGNLEMALSYLGSSNEEAMAAMRERLYFALGLRQPAQQAQPSRPSVPLNQRSRSTSSSYGGGSNQHQPPAPITQEPTFNLNPTTGRQSSPAVSSGRAKHVLDPSVASGPAPYYPSTTAPSYGFQPSSVPAPIPVQSPYSAPAPVPTFQAPVSAAPAPYTYQPTSNFNPANTFQPGPTQSTPAPVGPPPSTQPPGWNDPPALSSTRIQGQEMSAHHAGTRKWREVIKHSHDQVSLTPPTLSTSPKKEVQAVTPITQPLLGGPEPAVNGFQPYDPYNQYQQQGGYGAPPTQFGASRPPPSQMPPGSQPQSIYPPPPSGAQPIQSSYPPPPSGIQPPQSTYPPPPTQISRPPSVPPTSYPPPPSQNTFPPVQAPHSNNYAAPPTSAYPPPPQSQSRPPSQPSFGQTPSYPQQSFSSNPPSNYPTSAPTPPVSKTFASNQHVEYPPVAPAVYQPNQPAPPLQQQSAPQQPVAPVRKAIPEEHIHLQTVFEELRNRCAATAANPQSKRKLEEVARRLEALYDGLAEQKFSPATLQGLHGIAQRIQNGDYAGGLTQHTTLVSGPDFSQIAPFMPGIKSLLQTAMQLQVYL